MATKRGFNYFFVRHNYSKVVTAVKVLSELNALIHTYTEKKREIDRGSGHLFQLTKKQRNKANKNEFTITSERNW